LVHCRDFPIKRANVNVANTVVSDATMITATAMNGTSTVANVTFDGAVHVVYQATAANVISRVQDGWLFT